MHDYNISETTRLSKTPAHQSPLSGGRIALSAKNASRRTQRGFDLIQLGLVVALIGLLMAGAMIGVPKLVENIKSNQQADDIRTFVAQSQAHFAMFIPEELSLISANQASLYPSTATGTPTALSATYPSRFGGNVAVSLVTATRAMTITVNGIPSVAVCTKMGAQLAGIASSMTVGPTAITSPGGRISMSELSAACATGRAATGNGEDGNPVVPGTTFASELSFTTRI